MRAAAGRGGGGGGGGSTDIIEEIYIAPEFVMGLKETAHDGAFVASIGKLGFRNFPKPAKVTQATPVAECEEAG